MESFPEQLQAFEQWVRARRLYSDADRCHQLQPQVGPRGLIVAGEL